MPDFEVKIENLDKLRNTLEKSRDIVEPILQRGVETAVDILAKYTIKGVVPWDTGALTQTFAKNVGKLQAAWLPTRYYAIFVHEGTRYIKANPFLPKIAKLAEKDINQNFNDTLKIITEKLAS